MSIFIKIIDSKNNEVYLNTDFIINFSSISDDGEYNTTIYFNNNLVLTKTTVEEILNQIKSSKKV